MNYGVFVDNNSVTLVDTTFVVDVANYSFRNDEVNPDGCDTCLATNHIVVFDCAYIKNVVPVALQFVTSALGKDRDANPCGVHSETIRNRLYKNLFGNTFQIGSHLCLLKSSKNYVLSVSFFY